MKVWSGVAVIFVCLAAAIAIARDDIVDFLCEGNDDPWYLQAGRYEGTWQFEGDPKELDRFAPGLQRIEFRIEDPSPGSWRGKNPPPGGEPLRTAPKGSGTCVVDGREYAFRLFGGQAMFEHASGWIQFDERPRFLTGSAYGEGFGMDLEAARRPANDWLFLWFGRNDDGSNYGFAFSRVEP